MHHISQIAPSTPDTIRIVTEHELPRLCDIVETKQDITGRLSAKTILDLVNEGHIRPAVGVPSLGCFGECQRGCLMLLTTGSNLVLPEQCQRNQLGSLTTN